ncbi:MAG: hypothetical protein QG623_730 [Patescibacteria group bacterium]|nr:hypothetical protein [Patescibacteria group bacterium]
MSSLRQKKEYVVYRIWLGDRGSKAEFSELMKKLESGWEIVSAIAAEDIAIYILRVTV